MDFVYLNKRDGKSCEEERTRWCIAADVGIIVELV
jgi:hypothetical protein